MILHHQKTGIATAYSVSGMFTTALRFVAGWTYFSAFWRRLILENKLNSEEAGYIGEKFNHFLPNALGIKPVIEYLVTHPEALWWAMVAFTIIEGIAGLLFMFGIFTRLMAIGVFALAMGILLGSGWLGTTCLDEWQIGVLGVASGFTIFFSGAGQYSFDHLLISKRYKITSKRYFAWIASGGLPILPKTLNKIVFSGAIVILFLTLFTNQYFHGGVWGTLHNKSVIPKVEISNVSIQSKKLSFTVFRVEGADVYGSFLIGVQLNNASGKTLLELDGRQLSMLPASMIENKYVAKVKPGKHSLVIPLGSMATINLKHHTLENLSGGEYELILTDISGLIWKSTVVL